MPSSKPYDILYPVTLLPNAVLIKEGSPVLQWSNKKPWKFCVTLWSLSQSCCPWKCEEWVSNKNQKSHFISGLQVSPAFWGYLERSCASGTRKETRVSRVKPAHGIPWISLRASSPIWASEASRARTRERAARARGAGASPLACLSRVYFSRYPRMESLLCG